VEAIVADEIVETLVRVVRDTAVRAALGQPLQSVPDDERERVLERLRDYLRGAEEAVRECVRLAVLSGEDRIHRAVHAHPGIDHLMVDETIAFVREQEDER
jgi:hypothetical protein